MKLALVDLKKYSRDGSRGGQKAKNPGRAVEADVTSVEATKRMAKETIDAFGQIDVLVNNAGIIVIAVYR